ncbi:carbonic anhydrase [Patescibacteria group bacterium]
MEKKILYSGLFESKGVHNCDTMVIFCVDHRFEEVTYLFVKERYKRFDLVPFAGVSKAILDANFDDLDNIVNATLNIAFGLHNVKRVVLVGHQDCGAYGGSKAFNSVEEERNFQFDQLIKAREKILLKNPNTEVELFFASLDEREESIEIREIKV